MYHVGITGASSFAGYWIAHVLASRGFRVSHLFARSLTDYQGVRRERVSGASGESFFNVDATRGDLQRWIREYRPEVWIHHHHWMKDFRTADYDLKLARKIGIDPLARVVEQLVESGCKGVIFSGTYCEPGEGGGEAPIHRSGYAQSKREVWTALSELCKAHGLPLSKIVIPNPVGPLEDPERLTPSLLSAVREGRKFEVRAPHSEIDFIPVKAMAGVYAESVADILKGKFGIRRPSGLTTSVADWTQRVLQQVAYRRLKWPEHPIHYFEEPAAETLHNPAAEKITCDWDAFWDELAESIRPI